MLKNLKVIDLSTVLAGPSVATFFAELGAQVIKVENPHQLDVTRSWKLAAEDKDSPVSAYFASVNYGKAYRLLDLSDPGDHRAFLNLVSDADMLISNFKKGDDQKFQITDEQLHALNPRLIIGKITGYGEDSDRVAYDLILQAESGFMSINGTEESGPVKMPVALIDVLAAHHLKEGMLLALYERETTRKGKTVRVSLYDAAISSLVNQASNYLMTGEIPQRIGSNHPNIAPYGELFHTKDGKIITFAIGSDAHFYKLCEALELGTLVVSAAFMTNRDRVINRDLLAKLIALKVEDENSKRILRKLREANVPAGIVMDLEAVFAEEKAQQLIREELIEGVLTKRITSIAFK